MNGGGAKISVLAGEQCACVKIVGRATFNSSPDFTSLVDGLARRGVSQFILDLAECTLMDSTFLGALAGLGLKMNPTQAEACPTAVQLLNPTPRILELLESLGILHLFRVTQGDAVLTEPLAPQTHAPGAHTRQTVTRACLEAHQTLMALNPANAAKFKDVAQFLAEDLKKCQNTPQSGGSEPG